MFSHLRKSCAKRPGCNPNRQRRHSAYNPVRRWKPYFSLFYPECFHIHYKKRSYMDFFRGIFCIPNFHLNLFLKHLVKNYLNFVLRMFRQAKSFIDYLAHLRQPKGCLACFANCGVHWRYSIKRLFPLPQKKLNLELADNEFLGYNRVK